MAHSLRPILLTFASATALVSMGAAPSLAALNTTAVTTQASDSVLDAFGLGSNSSASWDTLDQRGSVYTFTNFVVPNDDGGVTVGTLVLDSPEITDAGPMFASLTLTDIEAAAGGDGAFSIEGLSISAPGVQGAEVIAALLSGREPDMEAENLSLSELGSFSLSGLSLEFSGEDGETGTAALARLSSEIDADAGKVDFGLAGLSMDVVTEEGMPVTMGMASLDATGFSLAALEAYGGADAGVDLSGLTGLDTYDAIELMDLEVNVGGIVVAMPELTAEMDETRRGLVSRSAMPSLTVSADAAAGPQAAQFAGILAGLGYEQLVFSAVGQSVYDEASDTVVTEGENYFRLEDGFEIRTDQSISGVAMYADALVSAMSGATTEEEINAATLEAAQLLIIERFVFSLEDQSLLERGLGLAAQMQGGTPESLRMQAAGFAAMIPAFTGGVLPPELATDLQIALSAFINQGGTLTFGVQPDQPISVGDMIAAGMASDISGLGLTVSHEAP